MTINGLAKCEPQRRHKHTTYTTQQTPDIPDLRRCIHYINLTNGLEALTTLHALRLPPRVTRIQSTHCEQQHLEQLCLGLGPDLLLHLATGHCCLVWDLGSRNKKRGVPRALWYGLEFIRYTLALAWYDQQVDAYLRGHCVTRTFHTHYRAFAQSTVRYGTGWQQHHYANTCVICNLRQHTSCSRVCFSLNMNTMEHPTNTFGHDDSMLRYYRKYVTVATDHSTPHVLSSTTLIPLYGVYKATLRDGDDSLHRTLAAELLATGCHTRAVDNVAQQQQHVVGKAGEDAPLPVTVLAAHDYQLFGGGIGHAELRAMQHAAK